jgi:hypothetical protein
MRPFLISLFLWTSLLILFPERSYAQCPMCKISAESNLKNGGEAAKGLNSGILYMLAAPYLIMGVIGYAYWKGKKKETPSSSRIQSLSEDDFMAN